MRHFKTSLFILIIIVTIPLSSFSHDGDAHISPGKSKADSLDTCRTYKDYAKETSYVSSSSKRQNSC